MTVFKSALEKVKAEDVLKKNTEEYLRKNYSPDVKTLNPLRKNGFTLKRVIAVTCMLVIMCVASMGAYFYLKIPTSYLSLDINPSVELGVNAFGKVVSATGYNNDGKTILVGQKVINSQVKDAVNSLVKSAFTKGFILKDGSTVISVTSETDNVSTAAKLQKEAARGAKSAVKSEGSSAVIHKDNVALESRDEAIKLGITAGKLNLIKKLQALDPSITVDQYKNAKVKDIINKLAELKMKQKLNNFKD
jgi:hypothetical protein